MASSSLIKSPKFTLWILVFVLTASCLLYLAALTPHRFGFYHDDGIYVVTAKALATGQGYRIISLPDEPPQTKFPPLYPFLLSLIWRVYPQFPENLVPMMWSSVFAAVVFLTLTWCYLTNTGYATHGQALLVVALTAINWRTVILATGIYSEMFYAGLSVAGLWLAELYEKERKSWITGILVGGILGVAFLTRISGITLLVGVVFYFVLRRQFAKASLVFAVGGVVVFAWSVWVYTNGIKSVGVNTIFYTSYFRDFLANVSDLQALFKVIGTNAFMLIFISIPLVCLGLDYNQLQNFLVGSLILLGLSFVLIASGSRRHMSRGLRLLHLYVFCYLSLHIFWPYTAYDRFLMTLLPFLLLFLVNELQVQLASVWNNVASARPLARKFSAIVVFLVLLGVAILGVYSYPSGLYRSVTWKDIYASRTLEDALAIRWIKKHTVSSNVLLSDRDAVYYLYTSRKATRFFQITGQRSTQGQDYEVAEAVFQIIKESNGQYLIITSNDFGYSQKPYVIREKFKGLIEQHPQIFVPIFRCGEKCNIYRIKTKS